MPDGSAESFTSDVDWIACNLEHGAHAWDGARARADALDIKVIPWVRLAHVKQGDTVENVKHKLKLLVDTAAVWQTDWILPNYEDEAETFPPNFVKLSLDETGWKGNTGWSTLAWLPNGVDYTAMRNDPVLLQIFPTDLRWPKDYATIKAKMGDCIYHASQGGFQYVGVTYQTYDNATPSLYDVESYQHSVYPGNVIHMDNGTIGFSKWPAKEFLINLANDEA